MKANSKVIKKLDLLTSVPNPLSQNAIASRLGISQQHVSHLIRTKLCKKVSRKTKVHVLGESHRQNRTTNSRKLYEGQKFTPQNFVKEGRESFTKKFMIVGAMSGRGVLPITRVPPKAKLTQTTILVTF
jgi:hypothetical protein